MFELTALAVLALTVFLVLTLALSVIEVVVWAVLLPVRLLLGVLLLPVLLLKVIGVVVGGLLAVVGSAVLIGLFAAAIALAATLVVPLLPLLAIAFIVWLLARASSPAVVAR